MTRNHKGERLHGDRFGVVLAPLLVVGFQAQWLAWRLRLPAIPCMLLLVIAWMPPAQDSITAEVAVA